MSTKTFKGRTLDEVVPQIRKELGDDAVIVGHRETLDGGVAGFFQKRLLEVTAVAAPTGRAFDVQLADADAELEQATVPGLSADGIVTSPEVDALPSVDDIFPASPPAQRGGGLAAMFSAGLEVSHDGAAEEPPAGAEQPAPTAFPEVPAAAAPVAPEPVVPEPVVSAWVPAPVEPEPVVVEPEPVAVAPEPEPAAIPIAPRHQPPPPAPAPAATALSLEAAALEQALSARGLDRALAAATMRAAEQHLAPLMVPAPELRTLAVEALARQIPVAPLVLGGRTVVFTGPGGAGKTRCVAKLAAAHAAAGSVAVVVIALRSDDQGAELARLLAPHGVAMHAVDSAADARAHIASCADGTLVIVDTPGVSPRAESELLALGRELEELGADEVHLTVPATIGPDAARELVRGTTALGVSALVLAHADETEQLGTVVGLAIETAIPLSFLARGRTIEGGLRPAMATEISEALLT